MTSKFNFSLGRLLWLSICFMPTIVHGQVEQFTLENGIHVIINPIAEATDVGVETVYEVGFVDEPEAMVQAAHLLEHLVCYAPGAGYEQKGAMEWLNSVGMANAETMPDWTHYDYAVPAAELESVLKIEAARMQQTGFDPDLIRTEAARVYQETDFVETNLAAGMLKHAFMALAHSWKFKSKSALVRGGLAEMNPDHLLRFYQQTYRPENLTIAISGKTTAEQVRQLIDKHFGQLKPVAADRHPVAIDWKNVAADAQISWDSSHSAVCVAWNPPTDKQQQVYVSAIGTIAAQRLMSDAEIRKQCELVFCSNNMWQVGDLPVFVYAMAKADQSLDEITELIGKKFQQEMRAAVESKAMMIKSLALSYEFQQRPSAWARMEQTSKLLTQQGRSASQALQMVLLQDALNRAQARRFLGDDPAAIIGSLKSVQPDELKQLVEGILQDANRHVVSLVPK